jgi:hypothetical protein
MLSPGERNATVVVIELEPGWIYVKVAEPKPEPDRIELLLRLTLDHWLNTHPGCVVDRTQAVAEEGTLQGINVWYHTSDQQPQTVNAAPPQQPLSLAIEVNGQVFQRVPKEHIEAVVDEAIQIWRSSQDSRGTLVVINPQRIAVILDSHANRGAVLPLELVYPVIDDSARTAVENWLKALPTRRHVFLIDRSWFLPRSGYDLPRRIVEPSFMRTNMTYDPGRRPQNRPDVK